MEAEVKDIVKKRVFHQASLSYFLVVAFYMVFFVCGAGCLIWLLFFDSEIYGVLPWASLIASIFAMFLFGYAILSLARNRIVLTNDEIQVPAHWGKKNVRLQYETHIRYNEIEDIYLVISVNNSYDKPVDWVYLPMLYVVFEKSDGCESRINLFYYSKKQTITLIDEVRQRASQLGNPLRVKEGKELLNEFIHNEKRK